MTKTLTIIGLGAGDLEQLPLGVYRQLISADKIYARTLEHPVLKQLLDEGLQAVSFDSVYEKHDGFQAVYEEIAETLLAHAETESVIYAVPGHPMVAEKTVQLLLEKGESCGIAVTVAGGQSFLDDLFSAVKIDPIEGFQLLDGTDLSRDELQITHHMIIGQVYDSYVASEVKLTLMEKLPDDHEVAIVTAAGSREESVVRVPLFELDRQMELSNLTSVYVPPVNKLSGRYGEFTALRKIISILRGPDGCPWDRKQTHESLKPYLIEEAYELLDAINEDDIDGIIGELGDVLLQVMLHAQIGEDEGMFSIDDVVKGISEKMVRRHPHVFGNVKADTEAQVLSNWAEIKAGEKGADLQSASVLDGAGKSVPNLIRAYEYQKRAAQAGFDWPEVSGAWNKVKEEVEEVEAELLKKDNNRLIKDELGDLFFALVNVARYYGIQPEEAVYAANEKFYRRFTYIESKLKAAGKTLADSSLKEMDRFWEEAKSKGL